MLSPGVGAAGVDGEIVPEPAEEVLVSEPEGVIIPDRPTEVNPVLVFLKSISFATSTDALNMKISEQINATQPSSSLPEIQPTNLKNGCHMNTKILNINVGSPVIILKLKST